MRGFGEVVDEMLHCQGGCMEKVMVVGLEVNKHCVAPEFLGIAAMRYSTDTRPPADQYLRRQHAPQKLEGRKEGPEQAQAKPGHYPHAPG
jgi:hypothetical protein